MDDSVAVKLAAFFKKYQSHSYQKGEVLVEAGSEPRGIFYLTKGRIRKYTISQKGEELVINIFKPISFFPMNWAVNGGSNQYFFQAVTDSEVQIAPRQDVLDFVKIEPDVLLDLLSRVYRGTDGLEMRLSSLMAGSAYTRLVTELIISAKRFGKKKGETVTLEISEPDLAAQTGMTRETIVREMKKLKDKNIVKIEKSSIVIRNLQLLEAEVSEGI